MMLQPLVRSSSYCSGFLEKVALCIHCEAEAVEDFSLTVYTNFERKRSVCRWVNANNHLFLQ